MMSFSYFSQTPFFLVPEIFFGLCLTFLLSLGLYFSMVLSESHSKILSFSNDFLKLGISISIFSIVLFSISQVEFILFDSEFIQSNLEAQYSGDASIQRGHGQRPAPSRTQGRQAS